MPMFVELHNFAPVNQSASASRSRPESFPRCARTAADAAMRLLCGAPGRRPLVRPSRSRLSSLSVAPPAWRKVRPPTTVHTAEHGPRVHVGCDVKTDLRHQRAEIERATPPAKSRDDSSQNLQRHAVRRAIKVAGSVQSLAIRMKVSPERIEAWARGTRPVPGGVFASIVDVLLDQELAELQAEIASGKTERSSEENQR
jgi:DNA-binding transcriptional regulator YdaS (Cro superfamily)